MARRYTTLAVVGRGGYGTVYKARMLSANGFEKDVAIKLLTGSGPNDIARLRDEARILGLARDRALVAVDPPVELDGTWGVVMDFVEGITTDQLLSKQGALPVGVVLEVIGEAARCLDAVYHQTGPNGQPLNLVHRDLKPSNLQLTPRGEVKILDFGLAKAHFHAREAKTLEGQMEGTAGYIAPERIDGHDGPACDVFSLGTVMRRLLTGDRPLGHGRWREVAPASTRTGTMQPALALAARCQARDPSQRPTMRDIEELCHVLLRKVDDPPLRRWAEQHVPAHPVLEPDDRVGMTWEEQRLPIEWEQESPSPPNRPLPPPRGRQVAVAPPPPPVNLPAPPSGALARGTIRPTTLSTEDEDMLTSDLPAPPIRNRSDSNPAVVASLSFMVVFLMGMLWIVVGAGNDINDAARFSRQSDMAFIAKLDRESTHIGEMLVTAGAAPDRISIDIDEFRRFRTRDSGRNLLSRWERLLPVLPTPVNAIDASNRRELNAQIDELWRTHQAAVQAELQWADQIHGAPSMLAVAIGLAQPPH